jgi:hypothetical protein
MMDAPTITFIIVASCGALILGMAGLIKGMVSKRFDEMTDEMRHGFSDLSSEVRQVRTELHEIDKRLAVLEREHQMLVGHHHCTADV